MITGEIKNKIDSLWDVFAAGGIVNPLEVVEQITYLMFIKDLDDIDIMSSKEDSMLGVKHETIFKEKVLVNDREINGDTLRWSNFKHYEAKKMYGLVQNDIFPFIKNLHAEKESAYSKYMGDAIFKIPTPQLLQKVVSALDEIYDIMNSMEKSDVRGDVYEYLLSKISQSGLNGQFRTPRHIIKMMVELMKPNEKDFICDIKSTSLIQSHSSHNCKKVA